MNIFSKGNIYIMLFIFIGLAYVLFLVYQNVYANQKEHFEEPVNDKQYKANLQVIKVFDVVLNRKPTNEELEKYGKSENEQDILIAVMNDFKNGAKPKEPVAQPIKAPETVQTPAPESKPEVKEETSFATSFKEAYDNIVNEETARVCLNKADLVNMLTNLSQQVNSFMALVK